MPTSIVPLQHQSDPVPPPSSLPVGHGDPCPEPQSHTSESSSDLNHNTNTNDANERPAHLNSLPPPVIGIVKQEHQNHGGPSGVAQPGLFTQGLPGLNAGIPNNLNAPLGGPPHPPNVVWPFLGNIAPVPVGVSAADSLKWLAGRFLNNPRSRIERIDITPQPSGTSKVLIVLDINETV